MGRKIKTATEKPEEVKIEEPVEEVEETNAAVEEVANEAPLEQEEENNENEEQLEALVPSMSAISPNVQKLLRIFNSYDELYITQDGGVFPKDNKPSFVKNAVLYKNPFFKK